MQEDKEGVVEVLKGGDVDSKHPVHYKPNIFVVANVEVYTICFLFYSSNGRHLVSTCEYFFSLCHVPGILNHGTRYRMYEYRSGLPLLKRQRKYCEYPAPATIRSYCCCVAMVLCFCFSLWVMVGFFPFGYNNEVTRKIFVLRPSIAWYHQQNLRSLALATIPRSKETLEDPSS